MLWKKNILRVQLSSPHLLSMSRSKSQDKFHPSSKTTWLVDQTEITYNKDYSAIREWSLAVQCWAHALHRQYCTELQVRVLICLKQLYVVPWSFFPVDSQINSVPCWLLSSHQKRDFLLIHFQVIANICNLLEYLIFPSWENLLSEVGEVGWINQDWMWWLIKTQTA